MVSIMIPLVMSAFASATVSTDEAGELLQTINKVGHAADSIAMGDKMVDEPVTLPNLIPLDVLEQLEKDELDEEDLMPPIEDSGNTSLLEVDATNLYYGICGALQSERSTARFYGIIRMQVNDCVKINGARNHGDNNGWVNCHVHFCSEGKYFAAPAADLSNQHIKGVKVYGIIRTSNSHECDRMGGRRNGGDNGNWPACHLAFHQYGRHVMSHSQKCPARWNKVSYAIVHGSGPDCRRIGGGYNRYASWLDCHSNWCTATHDSEPGCKKIEAYGYWKPGQVINNAGAYKVSTQQGFTQTTAQTESQSWSNSFSSSITAGVKIGVEHSVSAPVGPAVGSSTVSAELSVSGTLSSSETSTISSSTSRSKTKIFTESHELAFTKLGRTWQWVTIGADKCSSAAVFTDTVVITDHLSKPPCCAPGQFKNERDAEGQQACLTYNMCTKFCSDTLCNSLHAGSCGADKPGYAGYCPGWAKSGYCKGFFSTWMKTNCAASCC